MVGIGTAKVKCPKCGATLDVPFYQNGDSLQYGMNFCHQCGSNLFTTTEDENVIRTDFIYWLSDHCFRYFCDRHYCESCPFHITRNGFDTACTILNGEQTLQIFNRLFQENIEVNPQYRFDACD